MTIVSMLLAVAATESSAASFTELSAKKAEAFANRTAGETKAHWLELAEQLQYLSAKNSAATVERMSQTVAWLKKHDRNPNAIGILNRIRLRFTRSNLHLFVDKKLVTRNLQSSRVVPTPIRENILGTQVVGSGMTDANFRVRVLPSPDEIRLRFELNSSTRSKTTGYNGPAVAQTVGTSVVYASKTVTVSGRGIEIQPTKTEGRTDTDIVNFRWQRIIGRNIAYREAMTRKRASENESNRRAQERVRSQFDQEIASRIQRGVGGAKTWLDQRQLRPDRVQMRSTTKGIEVGAVIADPGQLSTRWLYPTTRHDRDVIVQIHESLINNRLESRLGGRTIREEDWAREFKVTKDLQTNLAPSDPDKKWAVSFESLRPMVARFDKNQLLIGIRATGFQLADKNYPPARISASYTVGDDGLTLIRDERIRIDVDQGGQRATGVRQQVFRSLVRKRFANVFPEKISLSAIGFLKNSGATTPLTSVPDLNVVEADFSRQWLTIKLDESTSG